MKSTCRGGGVLAAVVLMAALLCPSAPGAAGDAAEKATPTPPADTAIAAVIAANDGKIPATGEQLWRTLGTLGKFVQLPVPFSAARVNSGIFKPRVVIAAPVTGVSRAEVTGPNIEGRLFLAANMEKSAKGDPRVTSVEFISWNTTRRRFDFGVIENMGGEGEPQLNIVDGGTCFACHKNRGPILGVRPWSNTTNDDILRLAVASGMSLTGSQLPEAGPFAMSRPAAGALPRDRIDGMALAEPNAQAVDSAVRSGSVLRTAREIFQLLSRTPEGRKVLVTLLVAIARPGELNANNEPVRLAINRTFESRFPRFAIEWTELQKAAKSSILADVDPSSLLIASGVRPPPKRGALSGGSTIVPGLSSGNGSRWSAPFGPSVPNPNLPPDPVLSAAIKRATAVKDSIDNLSATMFELARYETARSFGFHGLTTRVLPSNPRSFIKPPIVPPVHLSDTVNPVLLAVTIGLTDGDRRFIARALEDGVKRIGDPKVPFAELAREVFEGPQFAAFLAGGLLPDRDEFKDNFAAGLDQVLTAQHGLPDGFAPARRGYASGPRFDPTAVEEREAAILPTTACLRCHEIGKAGVGPRFNPIPPLAFDPFDRPGREGWLQTTPAKQKHDVLARMLIRLGTDADMPPEDAPEHDLFRVKQAATFAESKRFLTAELEKLKKK